MLVPKRAKHKKTFRGKNRGMSDRGIQLDFGDYGLMSLTHGYVTSRQIEAARRVVAHYTRRGGRLWIRIFPDKPLTKKPPEVTMGSGKGDVYEYAVAVKPGRVMFEMGGVTPEVAKEAFRLAADKLPVKTRFVE
ncbi:50S ribosomal protein L16 [Candidatus Gottesmanbacteria bacterium]|nr:50S ribosomal protein L16 [Candidatus Gottesmanbacteria bacterium]